MEVSMTRLAKIIVLLMVVCFVFILASYGENLSDEMVKCQVSGKEIKKSEAKATYEYKGKTYYFCMEECKDKFVENPDEYVKSDGEIVTCPVSGEEFDKSKAAGSYEYEGKTYYFCCEGCREKFLKDPEKYTKKK